MQQKEEMMQIGQTIEIIKNVRDLKNKSISNLILIIINDKNNNTLRKSAEVELKRRIKNTGWEFNDILHLDDKVIKNRGLDIDNYLLSPNVNMQQLMETYFMANKSIDNSFDYLLFSEKHLCNYIDFGEPFFKKICSKEIENLDKRLNESDSKSQKELLITVKQMLQEREQKVNQTINEIKKEDPFELLCANEASLQLGELLGSSHNLLYNISDEERYDILKSNLGLIKLVILDKLNSKLEDFDIIQNLYNLKFVRKDSSKLNEQKKQLLKQVKNGYEVNYQTITMQKALQKVKK